MPQIMAKVCPPLRLSSHQQGDPCEACVLTHADTHPPTYLQPGVLEPPSRLTGPFRVPQFPVPEVIPQGRTQVLI